MRTQDAWASPSLVPSRGKKGFFYKTKGLQDIRKRLKREEEGARRKRRNRGKLETEDKRVTK